jgi:hypothetical protein
MSGIVDYAGLFPPAKLGMREAVRNYADYLRSPHSWMLGRFICPVSRLEEFRRECQGLLPSDPGGVTRGQAAEMEPLVPDTHEHHADQPWPISAIIDGDLDENLDSIFAFNREHSKPEKGLAIIDAAEIKVPGDSTASAAVFIDEALDLSPEEIFPFFEIPVQADPKTGGAEPDFRGLIAALSGADAGAKIRTGGITPDAFPSPERVAEFIAACDAADVPFKATAGLHHPIRAEYPLTYETDCPRGVMHGFLNVFIAAAAIRARKADLRAAAEMIKETSAGAFKFGDQGVKWRNITLDAAALGTARETFALSYGSCSFTEPVEELTALRFI